MFTTIIWTANFPKMFVKTGIFTKLAPTILSWFHDQTHRHSTKLKLQIWKLLQNSIWVVFESMKSPNVLFVWLKTQPRFSSHVGIFVCANLVVNLCWKVKAIVLFADVRSIVLYLNRFWILCKTIPFHNKQFIEVALYSHYVARFGIGYKYWYRSCQQNNVSRIFSYFNGCVFSHHCFFNMFGFILCSLLFT